MTLLFTASLVAAFGYGTKNAVGYYSLIFHLIAFYMFLLILASANITLLALMSAIGLVITIAIVVKTKYL